MTRGTLPDRHNSVMRVLVVEDEELLAAAVADGLTAEGFDVDVAHDGPDGLWRAREGSYDAIVLDVLLPGMHGYKVCRTLARRGRLDADPDPHRQGRRVRRGRGARHRRRRLPLQAVLVRRAPRPAPRAHPARRAAAADRAHGRHARARPRRPPLPAAGTPTSGSPRASSRCSSTSCARTATSRRRPRSSTTCGASTSPATPTSSRCTSGTCARRSTQPFGVETIKTVRGAGYQLVPDE